MEGWIEYLLTRGNSHVSGKPKFPVRDPGIIADEEMEMKGSNFVRQMVSLILVKLSVIFICHNEFDGRTSKWKELSCKRSLRWIECICLAVRVGDASRGRVLEKSKSGTFSSD